MGEELPEIDMITCKVDLVKEIESGKIVVVDFYADWCRPCKQIAPEMKRMKKEYCDVIFLKVDVDEYDDLAADYSVENLPTILYFNGGNSEKPAARVVGASKKDIREQLEKLLK